MSSTGFRLELGPARSCRAGAAAVVALGLISACGSSSSTSSPSPSASGDTGQASAAACQQNVDVNTGFNQLFSSIPMSGGPNTPPTAAEKQQIKAGFDKYVAKPLADISASPPAGIQSEVKDVVGTIQKTLGATGDPSAFNDPALTQKTHKIDLFFYDNCAGPKQPVTATEYKFDGLGDKVPAGVLNLKLTNAGKEEHEINVLARKPGVTKTFDELLAGPKEAGRASTMSVAQISAHPGESDATAAKLGPGTYMAICTIPKGTTADKPGDGPPHFTLGMKHQFTVE